MVHLDFALLLLESRQCLVVLLLLCEFIMRILWKKILLSALFLTVLPIVLVLITKGFKGTYFWIGILSGRN